MNRFLLLLASLVIVAFSLLSLSRNFLISQSARRLVKAIETFLRHGMKNPDASADVGTFIDNVISMTSDSPRRGRQNPNDPNTSAYLELLGFSDSDSDSDSDADDAEPDEGVDDSEAGKAVRDIIARSQADRLRR